MILLAEFQDSDTMLAAARQAVRDDLVIVDAFTPMPLKEVESFLETRPSHVRLAMLVSGIVVASGAFGLQWWSAVYDYPINSGGRPLFSWPVFLIFPAEVGMLAAALAGLIAFLVSCGLPRLHHRLFDFPEFERASQDRFFLLVERADEVRQMDRGDAIIRTRQSLRGCGALTVYEVGS